MNSDIDPGRIYRSIYDGLNEYLKPESIPMAVVTLAKYQYQSAFVADQELNLVACLTEIMVEAEVK
jgi:replication factor C small subunit